MARSRSVIISGARRRASAPSRTQTPLDDEERKGSWSSWLLNHRRKSSSSAASATAGIRLTGNSFENEFDVAGGPDRKRLTSGSSALFEVFFDKQDDAVLN